MSAVTVDRADGVALVTLNRPDARNAINLELAQELARAALDIERDARAVLVRGEGSAFSVGGDLKEFSTVADLPRHLREVTLHVHAAVSAFARMDAPVIACVHGAAAGAGMSLALACDIVIVGESARFTPAFTKIGLTPDGSLTHSLPRLIGVRRALELTLTNRTLDARDAVEWGLATRCVPDAALAAEALSVTRSLASGPTEAFGRTKRMVRTSLDHELEAQLATESVMLSGSAATDDGREGIAAFLQKRDASFG